MGMQSRLLSSQKVSGVTALLLLLTSTVLAAFQVPFAQVLALSASSPPSPAL